MRATIVQLLLPLYVVVVAPTIQAKPASSVTGYAPENDHLHHQRHQAGLDDSGDSSGGGQDTYMNYVKQQRLMQVHKLSSAGNNITCNDGTQIGYYKRLNQHSKSWVIYLQGGGFCGSRESCRQRWQRTPFLMSSKYWPQTRTVDGILSSDPNENPYLWNANHIYVPYCSSDSWTGSAAAEVHHNNPEGADDDTSSGASEPPSSFAFLGSKILERIFESLYDDLPLRQSLYDAKYILLAGDSAGATGVILNLDKMAALVDRRANFLKANCSHNIHCEVKQSNPVLRGLADSGWFLDNEPYNFELEFGDQSTSGSSSSGSGSGSNVESQQQQQPEPDCDQGRCTPLQSIKQAMQLWNGQVPETCLQNYLSEPWRCYFGYRAYQTLRTPLFVVQWLYDEAQLMVDNIVRPGTNGQWNYVNKVVNEMRASLENVTALFAPSCLSHSLIGRKSWNQININGFRLPHILNSWEEQPLMLESISGYSAISPYSSMAKLDSLDRQQRQQQQRQQQQPLVDSKMLMLRDAPSGIASQPTLLFETSPLEQQDPSQSQSTTTTTATATATSSTGSSSSSLSAFYLRSADRLTAQESRNQITTTNRQQTTTTNSAGAATGNGQAKSRSRKRKRNNQQQQNRIKQSSRQRSANNNQQQSATTTTTTTTQNGPFDLALSSSSSSSTSTTSNAANELPQQQHRPTLNPIEDLLPLMDRSQSSDGSSEPTPLYGRVDRAATDQLAGAGVSGVRLSRSTIVEDSTLMLTNNVPDDSTSRMSQLAMAPSAGQATVAAVHNSFQDQLGESTRWSAAESRSTGHGLNYGTYATLGSRDTFESDQFRFIDTCGWPQCNRDCPTLSYEFNSALSFQF